MAVIVGTDRCAIMGHSIATAFCLMGLILGSMGAPGGCDRKELESAGLQGSWTAEMPARGETCGEDSCCSVQGEQEMLVESRRHLHAFLKDSSNKLAALVEARAKKFDTLFIEMMNTSKLEFHEMFLRTYGKIYEQNSDVFGDFFTELEDYYRRGKARLSETLEAFFVVLYKKMFAVINSQYSLDEAYLECVADNMAQVEPFGDVPQKFAHQLTRSFIATRTYYKALMTMADTARSMGSVPLEKECDKEVARMRFCGVCKREGVACYGFCSQVATGCLRSHVELNKVWDDFIESLEKIADRLVGPYNIEVVVEPLNIKISEAIMNFQDHGAEVSQRIFKMCGKPPPLRVRRGAPDEDNATNELKATSLKFNYGTAKRKKGKKKDEEGGGVPNLERLVREIRQKIRETRGFWKNLPSQYCNTLSPPTSSPCYNGTAPSSPTTSPSPALAAKHQSLLLTQFVDKMRNAYNGQEVEFIDDDDDDDVHDEQGSGSGSGDFGIDDDEDRSENERKAEAPEKEGEDQGRSDVVFDNEVAPPPKEGGSGAGAASVSLTRALAQFLLPIVLVWFGGAIVDLL